MRHNVLVAKKPWAAGAWKRIKEQADNALGASPSPPPPGNFEPTGSGPCGDGDDGWFDCLYRPGLADGHRALALARAYAITRQRRYGDKAKEFLLAWTRTYRSPSRTVGHAVAEPVGFLLKGFLAYDLVRDRFSPDERAEFARWAGLFAAEGRRRVESYRDNPWVVEAPYGNSATWSRALAVLGAAVVGGEALEQALDWNFRHRTRGGRDGSWDDLLEGAIETRAGRMTEERVRQSIDYALYTWHGLALIADVARRAGFRPNLFTYRTRSGKSLLIVAGYYEPYLTEKRPMPYAERFGPEGDDALRAEYRAAMELAYRNAPSFKPPRRIVEFGGPQVRAANYDPHITGYNAVTGGVFVAPVRRRR